MCVCMLQHSHLLTHSLTHILTHIQSILTHMQVPFSHGKDLYDSLPEASRAAPWWVPGRGHNDVLVDNENEFYVRLFEFFDALEEPVVGMFSL